MKNKYVFVAILLLIITFAGYGFTRMYVGIEGERNEEELLIVTSFYPVYVATLNIAGDCEGVVVENLSEPQTGCLHDFQLTPQDMILLSQADVFIVNGGGMESFLTKVVEENPHLSIIDAGESIFSREEEHSHEEHGHEEHGHEEYSHGDHSHGENAHVWMSISHYMEQIEAIQNGLMEIDVVHGETYKKQGDAYLQKVAALRQEAGTLTELTEGTAIITLHEAFEVLAEDYGLHVSGTINLDEERQVSAGEVADIVDIIREENVKIILAEDLYGRDMGDTIEAETDCKVYYLDTLVRGDGTKDSWLLGMKANIELLKEAFGMTQ